MKKNKSKIKLLLTAFVVLFATILGGLAFNTRSALANEFDGELRISPAQQPIPSLDPGTTFEGEFKVLNLGEVEYSYNITVSPYSVWGDSYTEDFEKKTQYSEMVDWISFDSTEGTVAPESENIVKYKIKVPKNAPGGNQNLAIMVEVGGDSEGGASGVQIRRRVAFVVYANISGDTIKEAEITENSIPAFIFNPPIVATSRVKNNGNIYTNAEYKLEVRNFFGNSLAYSNVSDNKDGGEDVEGRIVFPETERYNEVSWDGAPQLGLFWVEQTVKIFDEVSTEKKLVFICPIWFLFIILLFVAIAVFKIVSTIIRHKQEKAEE